ncbi:MAG: 4-vinyl reductase [Chloroflexi bacterium]|nr:4-vinyl reductase [Chloroflexota bacterium]
MREPSGLYYPNRIARYFFLAMEDVMGKNGLNVVLSLAGLDAYIGHPPEDNLAGEFDFAAMAAIQEALEEMYGARGGRGMALRIGRASFSQGLRTFGALAGMNDAAFRALPRDARCRLGLMALANVYSSFSDQQSSFEEDQQCYRFIVQVSPMAWGRTSDKPVCHALVGSLQECMRWISNGYEYYVHESACRACGDEACIFTINKTPIGGGVRE